MTLALTRRGLLGAAGLSLGTLPFLSAPQRAAAQATAPAPLPTIYARPFGEAEILIFSDGSIALPQEGLTGLTPEEVATGLGEAYLDPAAPIPIAVNVHFFRKGDRLVLIDAGGGTSFGPTLGRTAGALLAIGIGPASVTEVLLTHLHPDHIGGLLTPEGGAAFPNAGLHVSAEEFAFWTDSAVAARLPDAMKPAAALAPLVATTYGERLTAFSGEAEVTPGIRSVPLPGHTVGHTGFHLTDGVEEVLIGGDAVVLAALQFRHPDAGTFADTDGALAGRTRRALLDRAAADRTLFASTHLPFPGFGHVEARDGAYAWVPEEWRHQ